MSDVDADADAELMQEVLDVAQRQRVANVYHYRQADDLQVRLVLKYRKGEYMVISAG